MSVNKSALGFPPQAIVETIIGVCTNTASFVVPWKQGYRAYLLGIDFTWTSNADGHVTLPGYGPFINDQTARREKTFRFFAGDRRVEFRPLIPVKLYGIADNNSAITLYPLEATVTWIDAYIMWLPETGAVPDPQPNDLGGGGGGGGG